MCREIPPPTRKRYNNGTHTSSCAKQGRVAYHMGAGEATTIHYAIFWRWEEVELGGNIVEVGNQKLDKNLLTCPCKSSNGRPGHLQGTADALSRAGVPTVSANNYGSCLDLD